jgi:hypothetical protein
MISISRKLIPLIAFVLLLLIGAGWIISMIGAFVVYHLFGYTIGYLVTYSTPLNRQFIIFHGSIGGIAKWADRTVRREQVRQPTATHAEVCQYLFARRYAHLAPSVREKVRIELINKHDPPENIYELCEAVNFVETPDNDEMVHLAEDTRIVFESILGNCGWERR